MGILTRKRNKGTGAVDPSSLPMVTPWSSNDLQRIVFNDIFGSDLPDNSRAAAMKLPAIARGRNLIVSTVCRQPLQIVAGQTPVADQPSWITQTGTGSSPQLRMAWTIDDLMFYGWSCWSRTWNDAGDTIIAADRINYDEWSINDDLQVEVNGQAQADRNVIVFCGLHEGILSFGSEALADARSLYSIVRQRLLNPVPQIDLHQTAGDPLTEIQIDALIDRWAAARQGKNGGVGFTNAAVEAREMGAADAPLLIEARNAAAVDMARLLGLTASRVDATSPTASLNYETTTGRNQEFVDFDLALYMTPITARLSLDDVTGPGNRTDFDLSDFLALSPSVTGPNYKD